MKKIFLVFILISFSLLIMGYQSLQYNKGNAMDENQTKQATATFAGGCFWCMESDFEKIDGVIRATSGYTGGKTEHPTYEEVSSGNTGHVESVQVVYDTDKVSYNQLLEIFWKHIDPTDTGGQFSDRGSQYRTVIFYHNDEQKTLATASKTKLSDSGNFKDPIVTEIEPAANFYNAEGYHQDYYRKNPLRYKFYRTNSGRDQFISVHWDGETEP